MTRHPTLADLNLSPAQRAVRKMSYSEQVVTAWFRECGLPDPVFEHAHIQGRRFRLDVAWPACKVAIEVQGGIWIKAAHSTATGIKRDMEKRNLGLCAGWRVLECEPKDLCTMETADMVRSAMSANGATFAEPATPSQRSFACPPAPRAAQPAETSAPAACSAAAARAPLR